MLNSPIASLLTLLICAILGYSRSCLTVGFCSGFSRGINSITNSFVCTTSFKVKGISPNCPFPWSECTDTVLALSFRYNTTTLS